MTEEVMHVSKCTHEEGVQPGSYCPECSAYNPNDPYEEDG